jgi:hypothetical protein
MFQRLRGLVLAGALLALLSVPWLHGQDRAPGRAIPAVLKVPAGHKLLLRAEAKGVQIYQSVAGKDGKLAWSLEAPLADLFDRGGKKLGYHYVGPSWEAGDGSKVVRDTDMAVKSAAAPNDDRDIPWLLIKVKPADDRKGAFAATVYIQRVETKGGKPPATPPVRAGTRVGVPYRAVYLFHGRAS